VKDGGGKVHAEGSIPATRFDLDLWMKRLPQPWSAAMEAAMFSGWIYDHSKPHAAALKVAHPLMLRAIAAAKKNSFWSAFSCAKFPKLWLDPNTIEPFRMKFCVSISVESLNGVDLSEHAFE